MASIWPLHRIPAIFLAMFQQISAIGAELRILTTRVLARLGFREESFLLLLAILIGVVTAAAAVSFHELIEAVRYYLYRRWGPRLDLYSGVGLTALVLFPALGGLTVGLIARYVARAGEGHGVIDVMESVARSRGVIKARVAIEKIVTAAITIGSGGSAGAEGPIVQIGAGIASGVGQLFRVARQHLPVLIGCGVAAGISSIFNSPIGGVLFALEVILLDFSIRTFTPVVLASVIANVTTSQIFHQVLGHEYDAIFQMPAWHVVADVGVSWASLPNFLLLGLFCGIIGVALIRLMHFTERRFIDLPMPQPLKPAIGGAMLGLTGVIYIVIFGWLIMDQPKPISADIYAMPAFYGDGYGVTRQLLGDTFYGEFISEYSLLALLGLLAMLCILKLIGTCLTLGSGGAGGVIAPSVFLGAAAGGLLGILLQQTRFGGVDPHIYALVGMAAVLAAVVHAPLAAILILLELTRSYNLVLPAMLAAIVATGTARLIFPDSIYTAALRLRGIRVGTSADLTILRRMVVEQVPLEPATTVHPEDPVEHLLQLADATGGSIFVVVDEKSGYQGMIYPPDLTASLMQREALPILVAQDLLHSDIPLVSVADDLAAVLDTFARANVEHLPVCVERSSARVIGVISRGGLMRQYQRQLAES